MENVVSKKNPLSKAILRKSVYLTVLLVCFSVTLLCSNGKLQARGNLATNCGRVEETERSRAKRNSDPEILSSNTVASTSTTPISSTTPLLDPSSTKASNSKPRKLNNTKHAAANSKNNTSASKIKSTTLESGQVEISTSSSSLTTELKIDSRTSADQHQVTSTSGQVWSSSSSPTPTVFCEPPAYHEFPDDLFSNRQRKQGFVIIHILVGIYMFFALAVVCDEYFVASMEKICLKLGLSEDVAGATFMAAGSSAPELFASLLGVFVAKGDVGTGTIVGSAVFNILFVIGFCALLAGQAVPLSWWPLIRDSSYYSLTVVILISIMADGVVTWWEALLMIAFYGLYIIVMKFNVKIHVWLIENTRLRLMNEFTQSSQGILVADGKTVQSSYVQFDNCAEETLVVKKDPRELALDELIRDYPRKWSLYEAALRVMHGKRFSPRTRFICAALRVIQEWEYVRRYGYPSNNPITINQFDESSHSGQVLGESRVNMEWKQAPSVAERGIFGVIRWGVTVPVHATLYYTIPDCRDPAWDKWFMLTFSISMLWIAFFSYILVWMVTLVGYTFKIPDTVMGITFLAAGTSIPDAYSSLLVAKQGLGDMAVANSIGSNVFDILIGLALPWFLQTAIVDPGSLVTINSGGMVYNVILLFLSIITTIAAVHYAGWQLNQRLGICLMISYSIFLFFSMLIEFNIFGYVNPPECEED